MALYRVNHNRACIINTAKKVNTVKRCLSKMESAIWRLFEKAHAILIEILFRTDASNILI